MYIVNYKSKKVFTSFDVKLIRTYKLINYEKLINFLSLIHANRSKSIFGQWGIISVSKFVANIICVFIWKTFILKCLKHLSWKRGIMIINSGYF